MAGEVRGVAVALVSWCKTVAPINAAMNTHVKNCCFAFMPRNWVNVTSPGNWFPV